MKILTCVSDWIGEIKNGMSDSNNHLVILISQNQSKKST